jgi:hypothetical protein
MGLQAQQGHEFSTLQAVVLSGPDWGPAILDSRCQSADIASCTVTDTARKVRVLPRMREVNDSNDRWTRRAPRVLLESRGSRGALPRRT